jgi:pimeloyl-ACP methyl ester carboxylesterase
MEPEQTRAAEEGSRLAESNGLLLCYEEFGDPEGETILLVMGLGMQMLAWDEEFCELLAMQGYRVVRFDNRDVGLSSKVSGRVNVAAGMVGLTGSAVYTLDDMANDTTGLLDHLGVERAHLVGASMGGMVCQTVAALSPERVASLCSIMSSTGRRRLSTSPRLDALRLLLQRPATSREDYIAAMTMMFGVIGSPDYPADAERMREHAERAWDRCFYPSGVARQLMAVLASGDRTRELRRITAPTLVIHGLADKLIPPRAGRDTAAAIPGARLELLPGMGHDFPPQLWQPISEMIVDNARRGSGAADAPRDEASGVQS